MDDHDETPECSTMFEDDVLLQQTDWDDLLNNKIKIDSWKELNNNNVKTHVNKAKDKIMDQLEKETIAVKLMMDESLGSHMHITVEEVLQLYFGRNGVAHKYFVQQNVPFLSDYENFASFIGTYFLLTRTSSSASSVLLNKEI